jgi:hypothetical protein
VSGSATMTNRLRFDIVHGPARVPARAGARLATARAHGLPFHGLTSLGLASAMKAWGRGAGAEWAVAAPILEDILAELSVLPARRTRAQLRSLVGVARALADRMRPRDPEVDDDAIVEWAIAAIQAQVLTYDQSARVVRRCVDALLAELVSPAAWRQLGVDKPPRGPAQECQAWSVREGHTTSEWRVELRGATWARPIAFAIDVARDREAARELAVTTAELRRVVAVEPDRIVRVLTERVESIDTAGGRLAVPVVIAPWIDDPGELRGPRDLADGSGQILVVDPSAATIATVAQSAFLPSAPQR